MSDLKHDIIAEYRAILINIEYLLTEIPKHEDYTNFYLLNNLLLNKIFAE